MLLWIKNVVWMYFGFLVGSNQWKSFPEDITEKTGGRVAKVRRSWSTTTSTYPISQWRSSDTIFQVKTGSYPKLWANLYVRKVVAKHSKPSYVFYWWAVVPHIYSKASLFFYRKLTCSQVSRYPWDYLNTIIVTLLCIIVTFIFETGLVGSKIVKSDQFH